jgi:hypothetical protein
MKKQNDLPVEVRMDKNIKEIIKDYPVQVTRWFNTTGHFGVWEKFLQDKGYRTYLAIVEYEYRGYVRKSACLFRSLNEEEINGIRDGKYKLFQNFLMYTKKVNAKSLRLSMPIEFGCIRCGKTEKGFALEGRNLCAYCKSLEMVKEDINAGYNC